MAPKYQEIYDRIYSYCESEDFAGYDPFDGLNSVLFQLTPLKHVRLARLAWLQLIKRSPVDLRGILRVKRGVNSKALALFALSELSRYRTANDPHHADNAKRLLSRLLEAGGGEGTLAFGYNFDWQSRHFYAPRGTPAIVPTVFAARAFVEAFHAFGDDEYLAHASRISRFVLTGLDRPVETDDEVCFSYTPLDRTLIYNASLLAGETLACVGAITGDHEYLSMATKAARFVIDRQRSDGAWAYGEAVNQRWVDNFHTAYILMSLKAIVSATSDLRPDISNAFERGYSYWTDHFFLPDGMPKYQDSSAYPIDIHACAVAIVAFCNFDNIAMARRVAEWTIGNMLSPDGYFYYQVRRSGIVKTPFMRWGQAWMAYALARLMEAEEADGR